MDESDLHEYVERSRSLLDQSSQMNEDNTKARLVEPLLELLGWDLRSLEVEREYSMQIGRGNARADYALLVESTPVVFVEAKGSDRSLTSSDEAQLSSYMRQTGVDWGLLTNGTSFEVLRRRNDSDRPDEISLGGFTLDELPEYSTRIGLLSKQSVRSGESDKIAERLETTKRAIRVLTENKSDVARDVTTAITRVTGEEITQTVEPLSKEFVDTVVSELRSETTFQRSEENGIMESDSSSSVSSNYAIRLSDSGSTVERFDRETQATAMVDTVDWLIRDRDLITHLGEFPYVPASRAILSDEPEHPDGEPMRASGETSTGHFVNTNLNSASKRRYIQKLAEESGLQVDFSEEW